MKRMSGLFLALAALVLPSSRSAVFAQESRASCESADVVWLWKGALTSHSVTFKFGLAAHHGCDDRDFVLSATPQRSEDDDEANAEDSSMAYTNLAMCRSVHIDEDDATDAPVMSCELLDLQHPQQTYRYSLSLLRRSPGVPHVVVKRGVFTTPAVEGQAFDFRFAFSSCADEKSDPKVFDEIREHDPLFLLHMGDLHYHNIEINDVGRFRAAFNSLFDSPSGRAMLAMDVPFAYMWDDHDFGPDNSDKTAPGRNASLQVYREFVPHYELPGDQTAHGRQSAVYQAFTIGRVRFLVTDLRSHRTPNLAPDVPSKTVLGATQKKWLKEELVLATNDPSIGLIVWCSTMPWHDDERKWGYFTHEQRELVNYMQAQGVNKWKPVVIVSGDAHMLAVDDGSHSPGHLPVFHAAALGRPGSIKGGPYSHGAFPGTGQYGLMDVEDDGKRVCLKYQGIRMGTGVLIEYDSCHPERTPPNATYYPPPKAFRPLQRRWKKVKRFLWENVFVVGATGSVLFAFLVVFVLQQRRPKTKNE
ncbi:hypothetical protein Poli38472_007753 [Pythium oligandrum]|uniref:PhoD-like phosphatase metallophosphatase domain-containing protein n=1 Tax=Pythium oligandrum TaxID=41045 RepID=A0A8K1CSZ3_PYTOL|nr:hypothetical protein Poli38472_007753 [Pythium oligandrum]|eukprot:TMW68081.1 hypothetical protein Poli38472_007753 [Pythium oligandrum]